MRLTLDSRIAPLMEQMELRRGASLPQISAATSALGVSPPEDYVAFLTESNGAEGPIGNGGYLTLWSVEDLSKLNGAYHVAEFAPRLAMFGSDGGDTAYAFDKASHRIVGVPFVGMATEEPEDYGASFAEFLSRLAAARS